MGNSCQSYWQRSVWEGLDQPLGLLRSDGTRVLNYNWRGLGESSVFTNGAPGDASIFGGTVAVDWPTRTQGGVYFTPNVLASGPSGPFTWFGTLAENGAGSTGLLYKRNRYFDPVSGRFTQADPIGLGGGLNLYGFANGDPVNFTDPFGLCPDAIAVGFGSLQCAIEDVIGAVKAGPGMAWNALSTKTPKRDLVVGLALVPLTVVDGVGFADDAARAIGKGHAFAKHVLDEGEFAGLGIRTVKQFQSFVGDIMRNATGNNVRKFSRGRTGFWDDATGTVVIRDPRSPDQGTAFRPTNGRAYYNNLK